MTTKLCPAVLERLALIPNEQIAHAFKKGATLQREHDLKEFERIIIEYFGKEDDGKTILESLRGKE